MKGLTLWQPHGSLVAVGAKWIESRSWSTRYRGPLLIHAAASASMGQVDIGPFLGDELERAGLPRDGVGLPMGKVLAVANLIDCVLSTPEMEWPEDQQIMGDLSPGRYGWVLDDIRHLERPIPWKGAQGLWDGRRFLETHADILPGHPSFMASGRPAQESLFDRGSEARS